MVILMKWKKRIVSEVISRDYGNIYSSSSLRGVGDEQILTYSMFMVCPQQ